MRVEGENKGRLMQAVTRATWQQRQSHCSRESGPSKSSLLWQAANSDLPPFNIFSQASRTTS